MAERTRPIRIEFCVTEKERQLIQSKMAQLGTKNMGAYLRKMAIDGYIIKVDYTQQKKLAAAVSRAASNIKNGKPRFGRCSKRPSERNYNHRRPLCRV